METFRIKEVGEKGIPSAVQSLFDHDVYNTLDPERSGLLADYLDVMSGGYPAFTHLWVGYEGKVPVGMSGITCRTLPLLQVYVIPVCRGQGLGERLVRCAIESGEDVSVVHTKWSARLYTHLGLESSARIVRVANGVVVV